MAPKPKTTEGQLTQPAWLINWPSMVFPAAEPPELWDAPLLQKQSTANHGL